METQTSRILLADDNRTLRTVLVSALCNDYEVHEVGDGWALAEALQTQTYDLVITDLNLPHCTGQAALRQTHHILTRLGRIKSLDLPVLVITGMDDADEEVQAVKRMANVKGVLFKPLDLESLRARVDAILEVEGLELRADLSQRQAFVDGMGKVLVVDDEPEIRDILSRCLEPDGIQVRTCATVASALDQCQKNIFNLILLDFQLEAETAEDLLLQLYERLGAERVPPVLLVSGYSESLEMARFRSYPAVKGIVSKPFDAPRLVDLVKHHFLSGAMQME